MLEMQSFDLFDPFDLDLTVVEVRPYSPLLLPHLDQCLCTDFSPRIIIPHSKDNALMRAVCS
jgi:hypothetical protein